MTDNERTERTERIATEIMGWTYDFGADWYRGERDGIMRWYMSAPDWNPRERWDHAGMLWEKLNELHCVVEVCHHEVTGWTCDVHPRTSCECISGVGDTGPAAIFEAACATLEEVAP